MPRSTLRGALCAGALCLTATTTAAALPAAADADVGVSDKRLNIQSGSRVTVKGRIAPGTVETADPAGPPLGDPRPRPHRRRGALRPAQARPRPAERARPRAHERGRRLARLGRLNVYRRALRVLVRARACSATSSAAAGRCTAGSLGVAHKSLPCGTKVTFRHRGRVVRVRVIDRGPYVGGREYDLTAATARRLGFSGHGPVQATR